MSVPIVTIGSLENSPEALSELSFRGLRVAALLRCKHREPGRAPSLHVPFPRGRLGAGVWACEGVLLETLEKGFRVPGFSFLSTCPA